MEDQSNPVPFLSEFSQFERSAATAVLAVQRPLQEIFEDRQMLIESAGIQLLSASASKAAPQRLDLAVLQSASLGE